MLERFVSWIAAVLADNKGVPSTKRIMFMATGCTLLGIAIGLAFTVFGNVAESTETLKFIVFTVATMATGGYIGGKAVERKVEQND